MPELEDEFGDIISKARNGKGLSLDRLAWLTGISSRQIERLERYQLEPSEDELSALASALDLNAAKLSLIAAGKWLPLPAQVSSRSVFLRTVFVPYGAYGENCYIFACPETLKGAVVDPGGAVEQILTALMQARIELELVLITHSHGDHIGGLAELASVLDGIRIVAHPLEWKHLPKLSAIRLEPADDGAVFRLGGSEITVFHTPGHTEGSTCYQTNGICFVGDTLFAGSIGRPSSEHAYQRMLSDIRGKILSLPDITVLLPGHGPSTTVIEEIQHNPFF